MVNKQYELANTFVELIDEVLRVEVDNTDKDIEVPQATKSSAVAHHAPAGESPTFHLFYYVDQFISCVVSLSICFL